MKVFVQFMLLWLALGAVAMAQAASPTASPDAPLLSIQISTPQAVVKASSHIIIKTKLANISNRDLVRSLGALAGTGGPGEDVHVTDAAGNLVPETPQGAKVHTWSPNNRWRGGSAYFSQTPLKAGGTVEWETDISGDYDLSKPGEYRIQVIRFERVAYDDQPDSREELKSNIIILTVTP